MMRIVSSDLSSRAVYRNISFTISAISVIILEGVDWI